MFAQRNLYKSECAGRGETVALGGGAGLGVAMREGSVSGEAGVFEMSSCNRPSWSIALMEIASGYWQVNAMSAPCLVVFGSSHVTLSLSLVSDRHPVVCCLCPSLSPQQVPQKNSMKLSSQWYFSRKMQKCPAASIISCMSEHCSLKSG